MTNIYHLIRASSFTHRQSHQPQSWRPFGTLAGEQPFYRQRSTRPKYVLIWWTSLTCQPAGRSKSSSRKPFGAVQKQGVKVRSTLTRPCGCKCRWQYRHYRLTQSAIYLCGFFFGIHGCLVPDPVPLLSEESIMRPWKYRWDKCSHIRCLYWNLVHCMFCFAYI